MHFVIEATNVRFQKESSRKLLHATLSKSHFAMVLSCKLKSLLFLTEEV